MLTCQLKVVFEFSTCTTTRGRRYKFLKKLNILRTRVTSFSQRVINAWNFLPENTDETKCRQILQGKRQPEGIRMT